MKRMKCSVVVGCGNTMHRVIAYAKYDITFPCNRNHIICLNNNLIEIIIKYKFKSDRKQKRDNRRCDVIE